MTAMHENKHAKLERDGLKEIKEAPFNKLTPAEKQYAIESMNISELATNLRQKSGRLLMEKLDWISQSKKRLDDTNISSLASVFATTFDKAQIASGLATENIAVLSKIDSNMSSKDALDSILNFREKVLESKDRKK